VFLTQLAQRERGAAQPLAPLQAPSSPELSELREELRAAGRRRDALTLGAALLLAGFIWIVAGRSYPWLGWALLAAGAVKLIYGLWR
jgi:ferric-dicitrate binding protein FerR (iron transport regulator)